MSAISVHIDRLRTLEAADRKIPTRQQLLLVTEDIFGGVTLSRTLERPEFSGWTAQEVGQLAEKFGKFLSQVYKGRPKAAALLSGESSFLPLPELAMSREQILVFRSAIHRMRECARAGKSFRPRAGEPTLKAIESYLANVDPSHHDESAGPVIIPDGYSPEQLGRDIKTSLAALVNTMPDVEDVDRFWVRAYTAPSANLAAEHLYLVRWLASHDLGAKLDELGTGELHLAGLMVKAYDILEQYRLDAVNGTGVLCAPGAADGDVETLCAALDAVSWVDQAAVGRVGRVLDTVARDPENSRLRSVLASRLRAAAPVFASERGALSDIKYLNEGHVMLLCQRAGLDSDAAEERKAREQIRNRLVELGLGADLDRELPAGLDAWRAGTLEEFYDSRAAAAAAPWDIEFADDLVEA